MPTLISTVVVQQPQQEVFDYLADISRHDEWSPTPWRLETDPGTLAAGTKFTSFGQIPGDKNHRNDVEVTECTPPSRIVWETDEKEGHSVNSFVLTPEGTGTKVERTFDIPRPKGFVGVLFPVFSALYIKPTLRKGLKKFKQRLESQEPKSASA